MRKNKAPGLWVVSLLAAGAATAAVGAGIAPALAGEITQAVALITPLPSASVPALPTPTLPKAPLPTPTLPKAPLPTPTLPKVTPLPSITPLPSVLPTALPSPSLPVYISPKPTLPPVGATPSASSSPVPARGSDSTGAATGGGPGSGLPVQIPFFGTITVSRLDVALLGALAVLPLLFGIWMLLFGRTWTEGRRSRDAQVRLAIAHDLGMSPRELTSVSTKGLFKLREEAAFDDLTGVLRRAAGIASLDREVSRARRQKSPLSVVFVDVDGLKQANDRLGHKAGDELLRGLASALKSGLRGQDLVIRYGGDEFVCVLPDTVADAARAKMSWIQTEAEKSGIGFSAGASELTRGDDVVSLLGRADQEMYAVKARRGKIRDLRLGTVGDGRRVPA